MDGSQIKNIKYGESVAIVLKKDQQNYQPRDGIAKKIFAKSPNHPHGIKVRLMSGEVRLVGEIY